jgi:hypothetical protein
VRKPRELQGWSLEDIAQLAVTRQEKLTRAFPGFKIRELIALKKVAAKYRKNMSARILAGEVQTDNPEMWLSQGELKRRKKQEYQENMGDYYTALEQGEPKDPAKAEDIAGYLTSLAEDENAWRVQRRARAISISAANELLLFKHIEARLELLTKGLKARREGYARRKAAVLNIKRALQQLWTDHHMGANLPADELPIGYGQVEERRRFASIVKNALEYKRDYRDQTVTNVFDAGDNIEGFLAHDMRSGEPLADQFVARVEYLVQAYQHLAQEFPQVNVFSVPGNHDRNKMRHPGRATYQKWDSYQTMIAHAVRMACRDLENVKFHIDRRPYITTSILGHSHFVTHGDTLLNAGKPGKSIRVKDLVAQADSINATRRYGGPFEVFAIGHLHTSVQAQLDGADFFMNGPLCPSSGFSDGLGHFSMASQWLWETTEKYAVGDLRRVSVGPDTDADASLDSVIRPVEGW